MDPDEHQQKVDRAKAAYKAAMLAYGSKPITDASRWYAEQYKRAGLRWPGKVNPDAPLTHQEEIERGLLPVLERSPEEKWVTCQLCGVTWKTRGQAFPDHVRKVFKQAGLLSQKAEKVFNWPAFCDPCRDLWEARGGPPKGFYASDPTPPEPVDPPPPYHKQTSFLSEDGQHQDS